MNFFHTALSFRDLLQSQIDDCSEKLKTCPEGSLRCHKHGKYYRYYQFFPDSSNRHNGVRHHIPRKNIELAKQLAYKSFLSYQIAELQSELRAINSYLILHEKSRSIIPKLMTRNEGFRKLLLPQFYSLDEELEKWVSEPYETLEEFSEDLNVQTITGEYVRSKSESMIYSMLIQKGIPFRYECKMELGGKDIYPDFTIRHPASGKVFVWEHFGLSDDYEYQSTIFTKLSKYLRNDYVPGCNLIITFESKNHPLSQNLIHDVIIHYFG